MAPRLGLGGGVSADPSNNLFNLLLDNFPTAHAAYSLRKLRRNYTGVCCRIRRESNDYEADLHFTGIGEVSLDSTLSNFSSASSATNLGQFMAAGGYTDADSLGSADTARVVTWKDQSGNGRDVTNATEAQQPLLVSSGTLQTENGKVALDFYGDMLTHSDGSSYAQPNTYVAVVQSDATTGSDYFIDGDGSVSDERHVIGHSSNYKKIHAGAWTDSSGDASDTDQHLWFIVVDGASSLLHIDGGSDVANGDPGDREMSGLTIGSRHTTGASSWDGRIQELIYYRGDQSGTRAEMELDVNSYYSIY